MKVSFGDKLFFFILVGVLASFYGEVCALWMFGYKTEYMRVMATLGVPVFWWPFFDIQGVLSWSDCYAQGIDVYTKNPCDALGRPFNYSPLLLDLPFPWWRFSNTNVIGLTMDAAFISLLPLILLPRSWAELLAAVAASLSASVLYAVE